MANGQAESKTCPSIKPNQTQSSNLAYLLNTSNSNSRISNHSTIMDITSMSNIAWWSSTFLIFLFGAFGAFFTIKELLDPKFSDWISPGPGQALLGDSGRVLMYEAQDPMAFKLNFLVFRQICSKGCMQ
jgi:hypothetical protein